MAVDALQVLEELVGLLRPGSGERLRFRRQVGKALVRRGGEEVHDVGRVRVAEVERRHPDRQPWTQRARGLEEREQPGRLHLRSLAGEDRRSEGEVLVVVQVADLAAPLLHHVAVAAPVPEHQPLALEHRCLHLVHPGPVLGRGRIARLPLEEGEDRERLVVGEVELRHPRLDPLVGEDPRDVQLLPDPVRVGLAMLRVLRKVAHVAEIEQLDPLPAVLGQLGADLLRVLESLDVVAAEAAVPGDQLLPLRGELLLLGRAGLRLRIAAVALQRHEIRGDVRRLGVAQAQIGHLRLRPQRLRVLHPGVDPLRAGLVGDVPEIRRIVALLAPLAAPRGGVLLGHVAGAATDALERLLSLLRVPLRRRLREQRRLLAGRPEIGDDGGDFLLAQLLLLGQHLFGLLRSVVGDRVRVDRARPEVRHPRRRPPALRVRDPRLQPAARGLAGDVGQRGTALRKVVVALDRMAAPAAHVDEELLALREQRRARERQLLRVALVALRLHERALVLAAHHLHFVGERVVPVVIVLAVAEGPVAHALGLHALAAVAGGAPERLRIVRLGEELPAVGMRAEDRLHVERVRLHRFLERRDRLLVGASLRHLLFEWLLLALHRLQGRIARDALPLRSLLDEHGPFRVLEHGLRLREPARVRAAIGFGELHPFLPDRARTAFARLRRIHGGGLRRWLVPADGDGIGRTRHVLADCLVDLLVRVRHLRIDGELRPHVRLRQIRLLRLQDLPWRRVPALVDADVAVLTAIDRRRSPGVLQILDPVLLHLRQLAQAAEGLQPLVDLADGLLDGLDLRLGGVAALDELQPTLGSGLVGRDRLVVEAGLLVDLALPFVVPRLQLPLLALVLLVARLAEHVIDRVLLRLVEAEVELRFLLADPRRLFGLDGCLVLPALLGVPADRVGRGLELRLRRIELLLRLRRCQPLAGPLPIRLEMRLLQLEELALEVLPGPAWHDFVVDGPDAAEGEQHGEADERPFQALQLERLSGHVKYSGCSG